MLADLNLFRRYLIMMAGDRRITVWHMAIVFGILQMADQESGNAVYISRRQVMERSHIGSIVTYHKCMKDLITFGYIGYFPSYHPGIRSLVVLLK